MGLTRTPLPDPPVLVITDRRTNGRPLDDFVQAVLDGGARWILVREKDMPAERYSLAMAYLVLLARLKRAVLASSDRAEVAAGVGARSVHLSAKAAGMPTDAAVREAQPRIHEVGERPSATLLHPAIVSLERVRSALGSGALIGVSCHSELELAIAAAAGADYATYSPIFPTASKPGYGPPIGLAGLRRATSGTELPIVALGGIDASRVPACRAAGAAGVAVLGAVNHAVDPKAATRALVDAWRAGSASPSDPRR
jgi:thiamine-phosphate pyrophosphorylase